ncbi:MAG TPA: GNAT family N-acetyltransferase [Candidatus Desulfovibrio gallistercoris]|nr:GNAT family N-acetyltransferase [Candidatus Desulfovibrio gallistercoris]
MMTRTETANSIRLELPHAFLCMGVESDIVDFDEDGCEVREEYVLIGQICTEEGHRGHGYARRLLREAIAVAGERWAHLPLRLAVEPLDVETDAHQLVAFYESEGFEVVEAGDVVVMER